MNNITNSSAKIQVENFYAETSLGEKATRILNGASVALIPIGWFFGSNTTIGLGVCLVARKILSVGVGKLVYPATRRSIPPNFEVLDELKNKGWIVKKVSLYKSGIQYDAVIFGHEETINNGKWTMHALGNNMAMEDVFEEVANKNLINDSNTLLINGPSVGMSKGRPTRYQMKACFEAGLQFLEKKINAKDIVMQGRSLGGGMMGRAVWDHDFTEGKKKGIQYLFVADRTFGKLSDVAEDIGSNLVEAIGSNLDLREATVSKLGKFVSFVVKSSLYLLGMELDGISAAEKLSRLGIKQIVVQHKSNNASGSDGVISDKVSLAHQLHQREGDSSFSSNKIYLESEEIDHNEDLPVDIDEELKDRINEFFQEEQTRESSEVS